MSVTDLDTPTVQAPPPEKAPRVVALVPVHERRIIESAITSLMYQEVPFEYVLVIANNCKDDTVPIIRRLQRIFGDKLRLLEMPDNPGKKASALNYGFEQIDLDEIDYVFGMDADTIVDPSIVKEALWMFEHEPETGGICSAYRTLPLSETASRWERLLWRMQNIEFGLANAWRLEHHKSARVLPGVSTMFRTAALRDVQNMHGDGTVWTVNHLVEDYRLTLELKELNWGVKSSFGMVSWSDVPLKLRGPGGLWNQRIRWYGGTIDELRLRKLKKHSRYELFSIGLQMLSVFMTAMLIASYAALVATGIPIQWASWFLLMPVFSISMQLYRLKYCDQLDWWQRLITGTLVLNELYAMYRSIIYICALYKSIFQPNRSW